MAWSGIVVRTTLPRRTPSSPSGLISRSTVQRATWMPSRFNRRQTWSGPVDLHVGVPDPLDLGYQGLVALGTRTQQAGSRCWAAWRQ